MGLKFLARALGWRGPSYFTDRLQQDKISAAVGSLEPSIAISLREIETAGAILVLGVDPIQEAPMLALAMRQAQRAGAKVVILDNRPISLPFEYEHRPLAPADLDSTTRELLQNSQRPVIVCGTDIAGLSAITAAADLALELQADNKRPGLFYVLPEANAYGAAIASAGGQPFSELLDDVENGKIKALLLVETDPLYHCPDTERVKNALGKLELPDGAGLPSKSQHWICRNRCSQRWAPLPRCASLFLP